jgi:hypothetical protein
VPAAWGVSALHGWMGHIMTGRRSGCASKPKSFPRAQFKTRVGFGLGLSTASVSRVWLSISGRGKARMRRRSPSVIPQTLTSPRPATRFRRAG